MVSLIVVFWMYVILFAVIGGMRGWAKELLVTFSVILALTFTTLLSAYVPFVRDTLQEESPALFFWLQGAYPAPAGFLWLPDPPTSPASRPRCTREKIQDIILGVVIGAFNGYLIVGTLWYYMRLPNYPFPGVVSAPPDSIAATVDTMMRYMPPKVLGIPGIYFAVVIAFIFVIVVFI